MCSWRKDEANHLKSMKPTETWQDEIVWLSLGFFVFFPPIFIDFLLLKCWFYTLPRRPSLLHHPCDTWDRIFPIRLGFCLCVPWNAALILSHHNMGGVMFSVFNWDSFTYRSLRTIVYQPLRITVGILPPNFQASWWIRNFLFFSHQILSKIFKHLLFQEVDYFSTISCIFVVKIVWNPPFHGKLLQVLAWLDA